MITCNYNKRKRLLNLKLGGALYEKYKKLINSSSIAFSMLLVMTILTNFLCFNHVNAEDIKQFKVSTL